MNCHTISFEYTLAFDKPYIIVLNLRTIKEMMLTRSGYCSQHDETRFNPDAL